MVWSISSFRSRDGVSWWNPLPTNELCGWDCARECGRDEGRMEGDVKVGEKGLVRRSSEEEEGETGLDGARCRPGCRLRYVRGLVED